METSYWERLCVGEVAPLITNSRQLVQPAAVDETQIIISKLKKKNCHLGWLLTGVTGEPESVIK